MVLEPAAIHLIGCSSRKASTPARARDLFEGTLFVRGRAFAEASRLPWYVLSAKWGVLDPGEPVAPYDVYLAGQSETYRRAWGEWVVAQLAQRHHLDGLVVWVHAGAAYVNPLRPPARATGLVLVEPLAGLRQGERAHWYDTNAVAAMPNSREPSDATNASAAGTGLTAQATERVVAALLDHRKTVEAIAGGRVPDLADDPEANQLLADDPFAFLLGVIFDQGIRAERAWRAPHDLKQRLGHLNPARIAAEEPSVRAAVLAPAALHRFTDRMPQWVVAAAERVEARYGGDASLIWSGDRRAADVQRELAEFRGIGQKKAAMAAILLRRYYGVPMRDIGGSDIAFDVHVRRVLLRTGLAGRDDQHHMIIAARQAYPPEPGALDTPAWDIGRRWCRPSAPDCAGCPIGNVCPRRITAAAGVQGS